MALNPVPQREKLLEESGFLRPVWLKYFRSLGRTVETFSVGGSSDFGAGGILDGGRRLTTDSLFHGGRRV